MTTTKNPPPAKPDRPLIQIGAGKESIDAARGAINDILASPSASDAKVAALSALSTLCQVNGAQIYNCHFQA